MASEEEEKEETCASASKGEKLSLQGRRGNGLRATSDGEEKGEKRGRRSD